MQTNKEIVREYDGLRTDLLFESKTNTLFVGGIQNANSSGATDVFKSQANPQQLECEISYQELGATATDICSGDLTNNISTPDSSEVQIGKKVIMGDEILLHILEVLRRVTLHFVESYSPQKTLSLVHKQCAAAITQQCATHDTMTQQ